MRQLMVIQNRGFCNGNLRAEWNVSLCWIVTLQVAAPEALRRNIRVLNRGIRSLDRPVQKWNDPLNWHTRDGHTLRERKQQWREESDIPGSFSAACPLPRRRTRPSLRKQQSGSLVFQVLLQKNLTSEG